MLDYTLTVNDQFLILHLISVSNGNDRTDTDNIIERIYEEMEKHSIYNLILNFEHFNKKLHSELIGQLIIGPTVKARKNDGDVRLAQVDERIERMLSVTKLNQIIKCFATLKAAIKSYQT